MCVLPSMSRIRCRALMILSSGIDTVLLCVSQSSSRARALVDHVVNFFRFIERGPSVASITRRNATSDSSRRLRRSTSTSTCRRGRRPIRSRRNVRRLGRCDRGSSGSRDEPGRRWLTRTHRSALVILSSQTAAPSRRRVLVASKDSQQTTRTCSGAREGFDRPISRHPT